MGQRHQVFLIARVRPHGAPPNHPGNRRCIAAFHHQWCYDTLPLAAMRRLVTLIKQPDNAAIVRAEVRDIQGKYGSYGAVGPRIPDVPCPFTAALLAMAWTADLQDSSKIYASGTTLQNGLLSASMGCWEGDNNDGLSILDVTDPEDPAYCFLTGPETPGTPEQHHAPLDARGYLGVYHDLDKPAQGNANSDNEEAEAERAQWKHRVRCVEDLADVRLRQAVLTGLKAENERAQRKYRFKCVEDLADVPLLPVTLLREAWPNETFQDPPQSNAPSQVGLAPSSQVPNLADVSLDVAVKQSLESGDTAELEKLLWLPGKAARVKTILRDLASFTDSAAHLLGIALKELKEISRVDLTGFRLSGAHVVAVLSALNEVHSVDLSENAVIVADEVPDILAATPTLRRIVLMGCPSVDGARLLELVLTQPSRFKTVEGILHPAFLTIEKPDPYPCAFTYVSLMSSALSCVSLPFFTPAQVVQALTDVIPWQAGFIPYAMLDFHGLPSVGTSAFQGGTRAPGQTVNERTIMTVPFQTPRIPRGQRVLWTFVRNMPHGCACGEGRHINGWGFVRYTYEPTAEVVQRLAKAKEALESLKNYVEGHAGELEMQQEYATAMNLRVYMQPTIERLEVASWPHRGDAVVYDLKGFLQCMAEEGRPMPSDEAVEKLEKILYMKNKTTGEYCCPLMTQEALSKLDPDCRGGNCRLRYNKGCGFSS